MCIIYHNSNCSKSNKTLDILKEKYTNFTVINYLDNPPTKSELIKILQDLKIKAKDFIRSNENIFEELKLKNSNENKLINAMIDNPELIQRPIVRTKKGIIIGRPPQNVLTII